MVMGPTHSMSGAAAGLALAQTLPDQWGGAQTPTEAFIYAGLAAGAALLPDLDTPQATIARSFGPISLGAAHIVENTAQAIVNITRTPKDPYCGNGHRTATHTLWFAALAGITSTAIIAAFGHHGTIGLLFILLGLAIRGLLPNWSKKNDWIAITTTAAILALITWKALPPDSATSVMASAVTIGVLTHLLGDFITKKGVPLLGGIIPINGRKWYNLAPPPALRISASGMADKILLATFTTMTITQALFIVSSTSAPLA